MNNIHSSGFYDNRVGIALMLPRLLIVFMVLATISNGSVSWLKNTGWIDTETYTALMDHRNSIQSHVKFLTENPGLYKDIKLERIRQQNLETWIRIQTLPQVIPDHLLFTKLLKYLVIVLFIVYGSLGLASGKNKPVYNHWLGFLMILVIIMSLVSFVRTGWQAAISGGYEYALILIALSGSAIANNKNIRFMANILGISLLGLLLLSPIEYVYGLQQFSAVGSFPKRINGFMLQPNTMGIFAVCCFALIAAANQYKSSDSALWLWAFVSLVLIILSGSLTAAITFFLMLGMVCFRQRGVKSWIGIVALVVALVIVILIIDRPPLDSLLGRVAKFQEYFSLDLSISSRLFGLGTGIGSNTLQSLNSLFPFEPSEPIRTGLSTDSTPLLLLIQIGLLGCLLFYSLLFKAAWVDPLLRPAYLVFILCSLTINIVEVFPLNLILGMMLAHSFTSYSAKSIKLEANFSRAQ